MKSSRDRLTTRLFRVARWSVVMLLRPTVIAIAFNARNRGSGMIFESVDWRVLVVFILLAYSNFQVSRLRAHRLRSLGVRRLL